MDPAGGARGLVAATDWPGAHLVLAHREEGYEVEQVVGGADEARRAGLGEAERREELGLLGAGELRDLRLDRGAEREHLAARPARARTATAAGAAPPLASSATFTTTSSGRRERKANCASSFSSASLQRMVRSGFPGVELRVEPLELVELGRSRLCCSLRSRSSRFSTMREVVQHDLGVEVAQFALRVGGRAVESGEAANDEAEAQSTLGERAQRIGVEAGALLAWPAGTSTNCISAYVVIFGLKIAESASMRASGTLMAPRFTPRPAVPCLC